MFKRVARLLMSMSRSAALQPAVQPSLPNGWIRQQARHRRTAAGAGGSGGVGIKELIPLLDAEPPVMNVPVKVLMLGKVL